MSRKFLAVLALAFTATACSSGASPGAMTPAGDAGMGAMDNMEAVGGPIAAAIDLTAIEGDRLRVSVNPGRFTESQVIFRLPRVVQGTYAVSDFGSFTDDFQAIAYDGSVMPVEKTDVNSWTIANATRLDRVEYLVNDTYDIERTEAATPFSPSGTNIAPDIFMLNLHGFVGYFEGMTESPYEISITAPLSMNKSSALRVLSADTAAMRPTVTDRYRAERYFDVTDNPMMYGNFTSEHFPVGDIDIVLSLYSPNGTYSAAGERPIIDQMMAAQRTYLGDLETTDRYDIYVYLGEQNPDSPTGYGALEHHTSTVVVLPEAIPEEAFNEAMVDIVSHEFFHIVTPLSVHSEDVHDFDYNQPTFSKHLWMYEGLTEYFASHFQVYEGLQSRPDFYEKMAGKIDNASGYDDAMSFTEMSENILDEPYATNYANVYEKGALIGMVFDIILREQSGGERSLISFMKELSGRYGKDRAFDDDAIVDEITSMTYPEVGAFLRTNVVGGTPIDYNQYFTKVGLELGDIEVPTTVFFRDQQVPFIDANPETGALFVLPGGLNSTLQSLGLRAGDIIRSVNGTAYTLANAGELIVPSFSWAPDQALSMVIERNGETLEVSGVVGTPVVLERQLHEVEGASAEQRALGTPGWVGDCV